MLQQTRVETVIPYYERFLDRFPTVAALARAPLDEVLRLWAGLGYYSRARNLHAAATTVARTHGGRVPTTAAELRTLPGVGRYTAAAIASIAFDEPVAVLDGNVKRVLARLVAVRESIELPRVVRRLWALAESLVPRRRPGDFNQALMELGATLCKPTRPDCPACPLRRMCRAARSGQADRLPIRAAKKATPVIPLAAAAIVRDGRALMVRRPSRGLLGGLWTLPSAVVDDGMAAAEVLRHAVRRQAGLSVRVDRRLGAIRHAFSHRTHEIDVWQCRPLRGRRLPEPTADLTWADLARPHALPLARVDQKVLRVVAAACAAGFASSNHDDENRQIRQRHRPAADDQPRPRSKRKPANAATVADPPHGQQTFEHQPRRRG